MCGKSQRTRISITQKHVVREEEEVEGRRGEWRNMEGCIKRSERVEVPP